MIRLYYNFKDAKDGLVWSVDQGDISTEVHYEWVDIQALMTTGFNSSPAHGEPTAWLEPMYDRQRVLTQTYSGGRGVRISD